MSLKSQETYISRVHQLQMIYPGLQILYAESFEIFVFKHHKPSSSYLIIIP
jgi:hypothetical protein